MIIYSCTSELYYPPIATIGLIVINVLVFAMTAGADPTTVQDYALWYGNGLHPVQWVTSAFLHADGTHLLGNMLFLWPLGLLVEGKVGWWKFIILYMAISISQCAVEQTMMLGYEGGDTVNEVFEMMLDDPEFRELAPSEQAMIREMVASEFSGVRHSLGASSAIFGLLAVCVLWAPSSDFCVWWRWGTFEVPVLVVGGFYTMFEFWNWHNSGLGVGSAALHLLGLVSGAGVGLAYLRYGIPECDDQDIFTEIFSRPIRKQPRARKIPSKPKKPKTPPPKKKSSASHPAPIPVPRSSSLPEVDESWMDEPPALPAVDERITRATHAAESGEVLEAAKIIHGISEPEVLQQLPLERYSALYNQAAGLKQFQAAAVILQKSITAYPEKSQSRSLQLAKVLLLALKKPQQAKSVLSKIPRAELSPEQTKVFRALVDKLREKQG